MHDPLEARLTDTIGPVTRKQGVRIDVDLPGEGVFTGKLLVVGPRGAEVSFGPGKLPSMDIGAELTLNVRASSLRHPLHVTATVNSRSDEDGTRRYGFSFVDDEPEEVRNPALVSLYNRREAFRVRPDVATAPMVTLRAVEGDRRATGRLLDVSVTGIAVLLPVDVAATMDDDAGFDFDLSLPNGPTLALSAILRNRIETRGGVRCGLTLDLERTQRFEDRQESILQWVMRRQREILRQVSLQRRHARA